LFLLEAGHALVETMTGDGDISTFAVLGPVDVFGEQSLISEMDRRTASVVSIESLDLLYMTRREFEELSVAHPAVNRFLLTIMAARLQGRHNSVARGPLRISRATSPGEPPAPGPRLRSVSCRLGRIPFIKSRSRHWQEPLGRRRTGFSEMPHAPAPLRSVLVTSSSSTARFWLVCIPRRAPDGERSRSSSQFADVEADEPYPTG
jgi:CRP-like cAMP-binding protein